MPADQPVCPKCGSADPWERGLVGSGPWKRCDHEFHDPPAVQERCERCDGSGTVFLDPDHLAGIAECPDCTPSSDSDSTGEGMLARIRKQNAELDAVADELIAAKAPGYERLAIIRERDELRKSVQALTQQRDELRTLLTRALDEFAGHQSWRCAHPDRYPLDEVDPPDCCCGLHQFTIQARAALSHPQAPDREATE